LRTNVFKGIRVVELCGLCTVSVVIRNTNTLQHTATHCNTLQHMTGASTRYLSTSALKTNQCLLDPFVCLVRSSWYKSNKTWGPGLKPHQQDCATEYVRNGPYICMKRDLHMYGKKPTQYLWQTFMSGYMYVRQYWVGLFMYEKSPAYIWKETYSVSSDKYVRQDE